MFSTEAIYQQSYLTIPRSVFCDESLSLEAMVLYGFLLDRTKLSERNRLQDEQGLFVFCTIEEASKVLRKSPRKTIQVFHELVQHKRIYRVHQGLNRANKYYVRLSSEVQNLHDVQDLQTRECTECIQEVQDLQSQKCTECTQEMQDLQSQKCTECTQEMQDLQSQKCTECTQEMQDLHPSNNEPTNNDISHNENIQSSPVFCQSEKQFLMKAKLDIRYFTRRAAGEDVALLDREAYERYLQIKQTPPH